MKISPDLHRSHGCPIESWGASCPACSPWRRRRRHWFYEYLPTYLLYTALARVEIGITCIFCGIGIDSSQLESSTKLLGQNLNTCKCSLLPLISFVSKKLLLFVVELPNQKRLLSWRSNYEQGARTVDLLLIRGCRLVCCVIGKGILGFRRPCDVTWASPFF